METIEQSITRLLALTDIAESYDEYCRLWNEVEELQKEIDERD